MPDDPHGEYYKKVHAKDLKAGDRVIRLQDGVQAGERNVLRSRLTRLGNIAIRWSATWEETFVPYSPFLLRVSVANVVDEAADFTEDQAEFLRDLAASRNDQRKPDGQYFYRGRPVGEMTGEELVEAMIECIKANEKRLNDMLSS